jgi:HD-GYP domain-containing protein (c-di-GMP phosphodiesterase class II)
MEKVSVSQLKNVGHQLHEDVVTSHGSVLLQKGKTLRQRELDILKAFLIKSVYIVSDQGKKEDKQTTAAATEKPSVKEEKIEQEQTSFIKEYNKMFTFLKKIFYEVNSAQSIPVMEIRERLQGLIDNIADYHVLTFTPDKQQQEDYLYHNSIKVSLTSYCLAGWHGIPGKDLIPVAMAGLLHDIGNVKVDQTILNKPSKLTLEELKEIKQHTVLGYNILKKAAGMNEGAKLAALQHHEKEDGSGYPLGVRGDKIHIYAKIVAVADIFHAMTGKRYYKEATSPYLVLEQLSNESFGKLDPKLVQTFINKVTQFHNGTLVKLSNDSMGEIVFSDRNHPTRPWVNINGKIINLITDRSLYIKEVIKNP